ncbi:unnamed protein product [Camellia sinensis]
MGKAARGAKAVELDRLVFRIESISKTRIDSIKKTNEVLILLACADRGFKFQGIYSNLCAFDISSFMMDMDVSPPDYNSNGKPTCTQIFLASSIGLIIAAAMHYHLKKLRDQKILSRMKVSGNRPVRKVERFSHYVASQMGFADRRACPHLCKLASEYIRKSEDCEDNIYSFFADDPDMDS